MFSQPILNKPILELLHRITGLAFEVAEKKPNLVLETTQPCRIQSMENNDHDPRRPQIDNETTSWKFLINHQAENGYRLFERIYIVGNNDPHLMRETHLGIEVKNQNKFFDFLQKVKALPKNHLGISARL